MSGIAGEMVAVARSTMIETGRFRMSVRPEDLHVGDELPALARTVTREDVRAYADASGDQNPLHQDDDVARMVGFSGIIAHGMFTMGHLGACVAAWAGDPANVIAIVRAVPRAGVHG